MKRLLTALLAAALAPGAARADWLQWRGPGTPLWRERLGGIFFASPVAAAGRVYMVSETGETFVLRAGPKPEVLARNDLGERFLASPAISDGMLLLRSDTALFAVGARKDEER